MEADQIQFDSQTGVHDRRGIPLIYVAQTRKQTNRKQKAGDKEAGENKGTKGHGAEKGDRNHETRTNGLTTLSEERYEGTMADGRAGGAGREIGARA